MKKIQVLRRTIPVFLKIITVLAEKQFFRKMSTLYTTGQAALLAFE
jgi:hypothetical protein